MWLGSLIRNSKSDLTQVEGVAVLQVGGLPVLSPLPRCLALCPAEMRVIALDHPIRFPVC